MIHLCLLALMLALANDQIISGVDASGSFTFVNKCNYTIWPVILNTGTSQPLSTTGFVLQQGYSKTIQALDSWGGQFWGRTQCSQDSTGKFTCVTGDCGSGKIECNVGRANGSLPVTLVEINLGASGGSDLYDVSVVDGYNLPLLVVPQGGSGANCLTTGCALELNGSACPSELKVTSAQGDDVACKSPCTAFNQDVFCCTGSYNNPNSCKPTLYSMAFKNACPSAYSYPFDDKTSTFFCAGAPNYNITFCPSSAISQKPSYGGSPNPSPGGDGDRNSRNNNSYYLPFVNGTMRYDGAMDVNSSGATTCIHVLRSQVIAGTVVIAIATTMWLLCQH